MSGEDLARRAVACAGWMPGMRTLPEKRTGRVFRAIADDDRRIKLRFAQESGPHGFGWGLNLDPDEAAVFGFVQFDTHGTNEVALPDLDDPATLGCLLALVREAWGSHVSSIRTGDGWSVRHMGRDGWAAGLSVVGITPCEAEALVAALEAAPRREAAPC